MAALKKLLDFLNQKMIDPQDGIWASSVSAAGKTARNVKKNHWKANYHDVRASVIFVRAMQ